MAKRGRKPGADYGAVINPANRMGFGQAEEDKALVRKLMTETLSSYRKPRVKSDEEMVQRFDEFYQECAAQGKIPTVEELEFCTGYSHGGLMDICSGRNPGFTPETKNIIKRAKEFIKTFDAKLVVTGQLNPVVYIFRAKNFYGMKDQQDITVQAEDNKIRDMSDEEIAKWYLEDGKTVETGFTDEPKIEPKVEPSSEN